ncbi:MAG: endonuclease/exonuclease/phosphatase family protein [Planctomycetaceae bacterium]
MPTTSNTRLQTRPPRAKRFVRWLTTAHVVGAVALWFLIWEVSESHWLGSVVTFLPRLPWLLPGGLLLVASLMTRSKAFWINLATLLFVLHSVAQFNVPWLHGNEPGAATARDDRRLRIVSCNVQNFAPDFSLVLREVQRARPDVVAFQEAIRPPRLLREHFDGWHQIQARGLWVASKWPLRLLGEYQSDFFSHLSGIAVEVDAPFGKFVLADLHLMTARKSLVELRPLELASGDSQLNLAGATVERQEEARQARAFVTEHSAKLPVIVAGDFNMPTSSSVYRAAFGDLTNAFESSAWGFGFTAPCKRFSWWPNNTPWQRIDHILTNDSWQVRDCRIGEWDGSDHRLIAATLVPLQD